MVPTFTLPNPGLYDIRLEVTSTSGCSDVLDSLEVVRVTGDTEFTVSKLNADGSVTSPLFFYVMMIRFY